MARRYFSATGHCSWENPSECCTESSESTLENTKASTTWETPMAIPLLETLCFDYMSVTYTHSQLHKPTQSMPFPFCLFPFAPSLSSYNLRKPRQLILPRLRTSRHLHFFFYNSARLWNSLPHSLQSIPDHAQFRKALSHHWKNTNTNLSTICNTLPPPPPALTLSKPGFFWAPKTKGGAHCAPPSKNPVTLLRIHSSKLLLKACPKMNLLTQLWFPWKPWLGF